jgi:hypothetical protein
VSSDFLTQLAYLQKWRLFEGSRIPDGRWETPPSSLHWNNPPRARLLNNSVARVGQKPRRVWMPINDLLGFLDTFRLTDSWPVFVEIECFNGHASYRSTFSDRYRSGTFAGPA